MGLVFVGWVAIVCVWSAGFIGVKCYSSEPASRPPAVPPPDGVAGYTRAEAFTYLTLPEWFIVYSTDEYAGFIATRRPSDFPYLGSVRQYWGFYSTACAETKRKHPFETGYHVMLGVIGASSAARAPPSASLVVRARAWNDQFASPSRCSRSAPSLDGHSASTRSDPGSHDRSASRAQHVGSRRDLRRRS